MADVRPSMTHASPSAMPDDHAAHDRQLVVAYACDDLPASEQADARALVARCRRCAALVDDIHRISGAIQRVEVTPPRDRDFRLTAEDAERLRGSAVTRLLRRIASPDLRVLQPLAAAAMTFGILIMATTAVLPSFSGAAGAAPVAAPAAQVADDAARNVVGEAAGGAEASAAPGASPVVGLGVPSEPAPAGVTDLGGGAEPDASADGAGATDTSTKAMTLETTAPTDSVDAVIPIGVGLLVIGLALLIVVALARRLTKDPLLR